MLGVVCPFTLTLSDGQLTIDNSYRLGPQRIQLSSVVRSFLVGPEFEQNVPRPIWQRTERHAITLGGSTFVFCSSGLPNCQRKLNAHHQSRIKISTPFCFSHHLSAVINGEIRTIFARYVYYCFVLFISIFRTPKIFASMFGACFKCSPHFKYIYFFILNSPI